MAMCSMQDSVGNIVIMRPGSGGGEGAPPVVIQVSLQSMAPLVQVWLLNVYAQPYRACQARCPLRSTLLLTHRMLTRGLWCKNDSPMHAMEGTVSMGGEGRRCYQSQSLTQVATTID
jgi:hypothetical protein